VSLSPAANIAVTVATAMAERGDNVGPNVTLVLLAELEASQVLLESRDQRISQLEEAIDVLLDAEPELGLQPAWWHGAVAILKWARR
jgi:hypothetical protein